MADLHAVADRRAPVDRILRLPAVIDRVGLGRTAIYDHARGGSFPKPRPLTPSGRAVGWLESEINAWLQARAAGGNYGGNPRPAAAEA